jgi:HEPN domain-containing protein
VGAVDTDAAARAIALFEGRGQLDRLEHADATAANACLDRAKGRLSAASVLAKSELWESAFTTAYDAYRTAADAIVLFLGYRVPATQGGHRIATDIAHAALQSDSAAFAAASAERFRQGRHESEYFDPARPIDKTAADTSWAIELARKAIDAVEAAISGS